MIRAVVALLSLALYAVPARAMDFHVVGNTVYASGLIVKGDGEKLNQLVDGLPVGLERVVIDSPGGLISAAFDMAETIRAKRIGVIVTGQCASACFLMFAAGTDRIVVLGARVGVHSAAVDGAETDGSMAATLAVAREVVLLGATPIVVTKMITTAPTGIYWLTDADLVGLGVHFIGRAP